MIICCAARLARRPRVLVGITITLTSASAGGSATSTRDGAGRLVRCRLDGRDIDSHFLWSRSLMRSLVRSLVRSLPLSLPRPLVRSLARGSSLNRSEGLRDGLGGVGSSVDASSDQRGFLLGVVVSRSGLGMITSCVFTQPRFLGPPSNIQGQGLPNFGVQRISLEIVVRTPKAFFFWEKPRKPPASRNVVLGYRIKAT